MLAGEEGSGTDRLNRLPAELRLHAGLTVALRRGQVDGTVRPDIDVELTAIGLEAIVVALLIAILQTGGEPDPRSGQAVLSVLDSDDPAGGTDDDLTIAASFHAVDERFATGRRHADFTRIEPFPAAHQACPDDAVPSPFHGPEGHHT